MVEGKYEVWVCLQDNVCSTLDDWFCIVFNEQTLTFKAWEEGRTISDDDKRWDDLTDRMTFEV